MEELIDHLHDHAQVWETTNPEEADLIEVSEIWESIDHAGESSVEQTKIEAYRLKQWLNTTRPDPRNPFPFRSQCSLRIVWVRIARDDKVHYVSKDQIDTVVDAFKLHLAYKYYGTSGAGATEISRSHGSRIPSQYTFSYRPKLAAIWAREADSNTTQAIFFTVEDYIKSFKLLLKRKWRMLDQEMFIPFLCSAMIGLQVDKLSNKINEDIRGIENKTGVHGWKSKDRKVAPNDLETQFQWVGVMSTKTASALRKIRIITKLNHFALERLDSSVSTEVLPDDNHLPNDDSEGKGAVDNGDGALGDDTERRDYWFNERSAGHDRLRSVIALLENRADEQHNRVEFLQQRVQLQTQVVSNSNLFFISFFDDCGD